MTSPPMHGHDLHGEDSGVMHPHGLHRLLHPLWFGPVHAAIVRAIDPSPGTRIIDVGAGTGRLSGLLARAGASVVCLEPDAASLEAARHSLAGRSIEFVSAPVEHIPLSDDSVDGAVASVTAHHWNDQDAGFAELARVIHPGGRIVLAEFHGSGPVLHAVRRVAGSKHADAAGFDQWKDRLERAGFRDVERVNVGWRQLFALFIGACR